MTSGWPRPDLEQVPPTLVTTEIDEGLARAAQELLAGDGRIEVFRGDALRFVPGQGPFDHSLLAGTRIS